jgi:acyl-CoA synthetase (NDP forming)
VSTYLPDFATARNPLDATTAMFSEEDKFYRVFRAVAEDPSVGSVILSMELTGEANARHSCSMNALKRYAAEPGGKAMVFVHPFYENTRNSAWRAELAGLRIPVLGCGESGLAALRKVLDFAAYRPEDHDLGFAAHEKSRSGKTFALSEHESKILVAEQGIPVPKQFLAVSRESLLAGLKEVGYPAVLKVDSPDILHKTDSGGVRLGIAGEQEALAAFDDILDTCRSRFPRARIKGVQVQEMIPGGIEIILGVKNDPQLGPMLLVGMGGIFTELLRDVAIAPCPVNRKDAGLMLRSLKSYRLLEGYRGAPPADVGALEEMMVGLSRFTAANRDTIAEMELNPVLVRESGAVAVDALVVKYEE